MGCSVVNLYLLIVAKSTLLWLSQCSTDDSARGWRFMQFPKCISRNRPAFSRDPGNSFWANITSPTAHRMLQQ